MPLSISHIRKILVLLALATAVLFHVVLPASAGDENITGSVSPTGGQAIRDTLDSISDTDDVYRVQLNGGDTVAVRLSGAAGTDFDLYIYPPNAKDIWRNSEVAWSENPGTSSESISYDVPASGVYYVDVASWDSVGPYTLSITSPSRISIGLDKSTIGYGSSAKISGAITPPHAGATAKLLERAVNAGSYESVATANIGSDGKYAFTVSPKGNTYYQVSWQGDVDHEPSSSGTVRVTVRPTVGLTSSVTNMSIGDSFTLSGRVWPGHAGSSVSIERKIKGSWKKLHDVTLNSQSRYSWSYKPSAYGSYELRTRFAGDDTHPGNLSSTVKISVASSRRS